jgi:hypothetical protein
LGANLTVSGSITLVSGMTFTPSTYKVTVNATSTITTGGKEFTDFEIASSGTRTFTFGDNCTVNGVTTFSGGNGAGTTLTGNSILAKGNVTLSGNGAILGTTVISLSGSGDQTFTGGATKSITNLTIASTGGTVYFAGTVYYNLGTNTLVYTSGTVDWTTNTSILEVRGTTNLTMNPGGNLYSFTLRGYNPVKVTLSGNVTVTNDLIFYGNAGGDCTIDGSSYKLYAQGNITSDSQLNFTGTVSALEISGGANQTWTAVGSTDIYKLPIIINKSGNTLTLSGTISYNTGTWTYTAGTVSAGTSTLKISGSCTLNTNGMSWYNITQGANIALGSDLTFTHTWTRTAGAVSGAYNVIASGTTSFVGSSTFTGLKIATGGTASFTNGTTQTVTSFDCQGAGTTIQSTSAGNAWTISDTAGTNTVKNTSIQDSTASGGATWNSLLTDGNTNVSGNNGWIFTAASTGSSFRMLMGVGA